MTEQEIKNTFDNIQQQLDALQGEKASFMFIAKEGLHFVMGGHASMIAAQISLAMMRYPIVRDIIKECATKYDELNAVVGEEARNIIMDHQIEKNSGN